MRNHGLEQNENDRRMSGVIGMGKIAEVNLDDYTARVKDGEITTGWLRMGMMRALGAQQTWPYVEGEEVGYATISGDMQDGFIFCALANGQSPASAADGVFKANATGGFELVGDITVTGGITTSGDVVAGGISLKNHIHTGDSGGQTGKPS